MTRRNLAMVIFIVFTLLALTNAAFARPRVSVFDFSGDADRDSLKLATSHMTRLLVNLDRFDLVERADIDRILNEQRFQLSGIVDEATAVELGKVLGISIAFLGQVDVSQIRWVSGSGSQNSYYAASVRVSVKVVDVETGKLITVLTASGSDTDDKRDIALSTALLNCFGEEMLVQLKTAFSLNSGITKVDGDTVYFLLGDKAGVKTGARFNILRREADAFGVALGMEDTYTKKIGLVEVTATTANTARARIIWESEPIAPGDLLKEEARSYNKAGLLALQTTTYAVVDQYGDDQHGSTMGMLLRLGQERPYAYDWGGELGITSATSEVAVFNIGGYAAAEMPIFKGAAYLSLQGSAGANVGVQNYAGYPDWWKASPSGSATASSFYLGAGAALKLYLTRDKGVRLEAGAIGRFGPTLSGWNVSDDDKANKDKDVDVTYYVKYPRVSVSGVSLYVGLAASY